MTCKVKKNAPQKWDKNLLEMALSLSRLANYSWEQSLPIIVVCIPSETWWRKLIFQLQVDVNWRQLLISRWGIVSTSLFRAGTSSGTDLGRSCTYCEYIVSVNIYVFHSVLLCLRGFVSLVLSIASGLLQSFCLFFHSVPKALWGEGFKGNILFRA